MKTFHGISRNIRHDILGTVTRDARSLSLKRNNVLIADTDGIVRSRFTCAAILSSSKDSSTLSHWFAAPSVTHIPPEDLAQLHDGDIVQIDDKGVIVRLWDIDTDDNMVFVTNTCNHRCIMCPQPPRPDHKDLLSLNRRILALLKRDKVSRIAFTGGEPTLKLDDLLELLRMCNKRFPKATVALLTNGRRLRDMAIAHRIVEAHPRITFCVPLFSDIDTIHDDIVGVKGAFADTLLALNNLALLQQCIELRNVMQIGNFQRFPQYAEFIYRNLPFVVHIAFMGMETVGMAIENIDSVWVEPADFMAKLKQAIEYLHQRDMDVSIYNLPLCLVPPLLWRFAEDSISEWKKSFLPDCATCSKKSKCPGLFSTSQILSAGISPIP